MHKLTKPIEVLYITGEGRSGSTLLSRLFGEVEGFVNVGELVPHFFMKHRPVPCGCGVPVANCGFWKGFPADAGTQALGDRFLRLRHCARLSLETHRNRSDVQKLLLAMRDLYSSIAEKTGARVIVDSSKNPAIAYALGRTPGIQVSLIHLIRSPQGVVNSWLLPKGYLANRPAWRAALCWLLINLMVEMMPGKRRMRHWTVRYEDLAENPKIFVETIAGELLKHPTSCPFLEGNQAAVKIQHILRGNPDKWERSKLVIAKREPALSRTTKFLVALLTFPLMLRYGYALPHAPRLAPVRCALPSEFVGCHRSSTASSATT